MSTKMMSIGKLETIRIKDSTNLSHIVKMLNDSIVDVCSEMI